MVAALVSPVTDAVGVQDGARADEADAGEDLGRDAPGIAAARAHLDREVREGGRPDADQDVRAQAGRLALQLALEADDPAEHGGQGELQEQVGVEERARARLALMSAARGAGRA